MDKKQTRLMDQQRAVMSYLEDLLQEVPEAITEESRDNVVQVFPRREARPQPVQTQTRSAPPVTIPDQAAAPASATSTAGHGDRPGTDRIVPEWAEQEFQCLMFNVAGISLAVPLANINGVIPWEDRLTPMPGHSPAFLGLLRHMDRNVKVMDTARVILPPSQMQAVQDDPQRLQKIILMDQGRWGLACDDIGEVITLQADAVRWRTEAGKRPWLAGTISARLCALLDTDALSRILSTGKE